MKSGLQTTMAKERHEEKQKVLGQIKAQKDDTKAEGSLQKALKISSCISTG